MWFSPPARLETYPACSAAGKVFAGIEGPVVIAKILTHPNEKTFATLEDSSET
jgi:hypothetical protein